jgi:hypothetical protein
LMTHLMTTITPLGGSIRAHMSRKCLCFNSTGAGWLIYESAALPLSYLGVCNDNSIR